MGEIEAQVECNVNMKAEIKLMLLQIKEHQRLPTNNQKLGQRHETDSLSQPSKASNPTNTLISNF